MSWTIDRATPEDTADITAMIHDLAEFEHASEQCTVTKTHIHAALFGPSPTLRAHVARVGDEVAAMALWFLNFSTWDGVPGIYLEDLFVRPRFRRVGLARGLLSALAGECRHNGYTRLSWAVLEWNSDAIAVYDGVGAHPQREWITYRVSGPELAELAGPG